MNRKNFQWLVFGLSGVCCPVITTHALAQGNEPTRIVIEAEDMQGVAQDQFGPGKGWQVGRWGHDLYQNMVFGGTWASRLRVAMTDASDTPAEAVNNIKVPQAGTYKVWAKYEAPPFFNFAFGIRIESVKSGEVVFEKTYGLRESSRHFSFTDKPRTGDLYWNWGIDHDAAEGYDVKLDAGEYRVVLLKKPNPAPAAARSVDAILITSDLSEISSPRMARYPLLDELRRANHVYFRFRNLSQSPGMVKWNHWNHRYPDFYAPSYRELVTYHAANGQLLTAPANHDGNWPEPVAPATSSVWYDLGPTMNVESTSPFTVQLLASGGQGGNLPVGVDVALAPNEKSIVKTFTSDGSGALSFLLQPDLNRPEGVKWSRRTDEIYQDVARQLDATPRLGPIPSRLRLYAVTGGPAFGSTTPAEFELARKFRAALGLNTFEGNTNDLKDLEAIASWNKTHNVPLVERSLTYQHSQDPVEIANLVKKNELGKYFQFLSFGDEIGLPAIDVTDAAKVEAFRSFVKAQGETPRSLGVGSWEQVKPLPSLAGDVAVKIGVISEGTANAPQVTSSLKKLYWYSTQFRIQQGIESFAGKTKQLKTLLGNEVETSANLGSMHPFFWMHQSSFIEAFKHKAMSLAWSEDYTYTQPEASRLVADFEASYLRKGASYNDNHMMFYCMPHWPGNSPENLIQNALLLWGNNVKDLDWFIASPDIWSTENYVAYRGGMPMWKALRDVSGMAGLVENDLLPARPESTPVAMLLSESSDLWELEGQSQNEVNPGSGPTNVSQEERKAIWYALRHAGYRVDFVTEADVKEGLLSKYKALYVSGENLERGAATKIGEWVQGGGTLFATAGAARKNEFDGPLTTLDSVLGRGPVRGYRRYRGPLRAKMELLFEKPLDSVKLGTSKFDVLASKEEFQPAPGAVVLATYAGGAPAWVKNVSGKGAGYYIGALPGQALLHKALPVVPAGKGGPESNSSHFEPINFDTTAKQVILQPLKSAGITPDTVTNQRGIITSRLRGPKSTVLTVVNLAQQHDGPLKNVPITLTDLDKKPAKVWSCYHKNGIPFTFENGRLTLTLPTLGVGDVVVLAASGGE